jgi:formylmethanofuran dehydrogenase subunit E
LTADFKRFKRRKTLKKEVNNGHETQVFSVEEIDAAREAEAAGHKVYIGTACDECGEPIWASIAHVDSGEVIRHTDLYHELPTN